MTEDWSALSSSGEDQEIREIRSARFFPTHVDRLENPSRKNNNVPHFRMGMDAGWRIIFETVMGMVNIEVKKKLESLHFLLDIFTFTV